MNARTLWIVVALTGLAFAGNVLADERPLQLASSISGGGARKPPAQGQMQQPRAAPNPAMKQQTKPGSNAAIKASPKLGQPLEPKQR